MNTPVYRDIVDAAEQNGLTTKRVALTHGGEYHGPCPECSGTDRFILHPNYENANCKGRYWCRKCEIKGDFIEFCRKYCGCKTFEEAVALANATMPTHFTKNNKTKRSKKTMTPVKPMLTPYPKASINTVSPVWQEQVELLKDEVYENLLNNTEALAWLEQRGLPYAAVVRFKFGWVHNYKRYPGSAWGVPREEVMIPAGLLIPTFGKDGKPRRLKVRCKDWHPGSTGAKYIAIPGSMEGLTILGNYNSRLVIGAESELDAYAIYYVLDDHACVIAVGGSNKNLDPVSVRIAQQAEWLLICHDNDEGGESMLRKWREVSKKAIAYPTPIGKDIGEAVALGLNIREFFLAATTLSTTASTTALTKPIEIEAREIVIPGPELLVTQEEKRLDVPTNEPSPEVAQIISVHDKEFAPQDTELTQTDQPSLTPLNDLSTLIHWAIAYFNGIPDVSLLPSDRRLRVAVNTLGDGIISSELQKELRCVYRVATDNIL